MISSQTALGDDNYCCFTCIFDWAGANGHLHPYDQGQIVLHNGRYFQCQENDWNNIFKASDFDETITKFIG